MEKYCHGDRTRAASRYKIGQDEQRNIKTGPRIRTGSRFIIFVCQRYGNCKMVSEEYMMACLLFANRVNLQLIEQITYDKHVMSGKLCIVVQQK